MIIKTKNCFSLSFLGISIFMTAVIHVILGPLFLYKRRTLKNLDQVVEIRNNVNVEDRRYNNSKSNDDLANGLVNVILGACLLTSFPIVVLVDWQDEIVIPTLLGYVIPIFVGGTMLPAKGIVATPEIRRHVKTQVNILKHDFFHII